MRRAKIPPTTKKVIELIKYKMPIFLWSVVVSHHASPPRGLGAIARGLASVTAMARPLLGRRSPDRPAPPSRLLASHDEDAGHGRAVDVTLEVVAARWEGGELEGLGSHAG